MYTPADISLADLLQLHSKGLTDSQIAEKLGVSRPTVLRRRTELGLSANRTIGERGPAVKPTEPYWQAVRRALRYVGKFIVEAAREYYQNTKDYARYFISMLLEPRPMFHAAPGPHAADPSRMYLKHVKYITDFEKQMDMTSLAGVPGPAILELARVYKSADEETCKALARQAVAGAGYVNSGDTVEMIETNECIRPESYQDYWEEEEKKCFNWAPIQEWEPAKKISKAVRAITDAVSHTGRRGRGGGTRNLQNHLAFQAIKGQ